MREYYPRFVSGPMKAGKRYHFPITNYNGVMKSALFTGRYDRNGCAIMQANNGDLWSIPLHDLYIPSKGKKHE